MSIKFCLTNNVLQLINKDNSIVCSKRHKTKKLLKRKNYLPNAQREEKFSKNDLNLSVPLLIRLT